MTQLAGEDGEKITIAYKIVLQSFKVVCLCHTFFRPCLEIEVHPTEGKIHTTC